MSEEFQFEEELPGQEESEFRRTLRPLMGRGVFAFRGRPRRPALRFPRVWPGGPAPYGGIDFIRWVQRCLANVIGRGVPQNGMMGPATRRGIRIFQRRQRLQVTGIVDPVTESALGDACGWPQLPRARAPAPTEPAEPVERAEPQPDDAEPVESQPDDMEPAGTERAGAERLDTEPADASGDADAGADQEFQISGPTRVAVVRSSRIPVTAFDGTQKNARRPGIYIIYVKNEPRYVGMALRSVYSRFQDRFKVLRDFKIDATCLSGREVEWVTIVGSTFPVGSIGRRSKKDKTGPFRSLKSHDEAILPILERFYIEKLKTKNKGNIQTEDYHIVAGGSLAIKEVGRK